MRLDCFLDRQKDSREQALIEMDCRKQEAGRLLNSQAGRLRYPLACGGVSSVGIAIFLRNNPR